MAHVLPVQQQHSILTLAKQGWSIRRIARELGVHRKTVRAYLQPSEATSKCTTDSTPGFDPKCTISTPCVFRSNSDTDSDSIRTVFRKLSDSIPI